MTRPTYVQPNLSPRSSEEFLAYHLQNANLLQHPDHRNADGEREYGSNVEFWREVIDGSISALRWVRLVNFQISGWFPRSPGLFHTQFAAERRLVADSHLEDQDGAQIYDPHGKASMIEGGLGSVRFQNVKIEGDDCWLCTASDDGYCHTGVPLAIPDRLLQHHRVDMGDRFAIVGRLWFLPPFLSERFGHLLGIPQLYLYVDRLDRTTPSTGDQFISPMVFFTSRTASGELQSSVTYVNCLSKSPKEIDAAAEWLKWYTNRYHGEIKTNFDQQRPIFENAPFSLQKVMTGRADLAELQSIITNEELRTELLQSTRAIILNNPIFGDRVAGDKIAGDEYEIGRSEMKVSSSGDDSKEGTLDGSGGGVLSISNAIVAKLGQIAGLAGIALGVLLVVFRSTLEKDFLPKGGLNSDQAYHIMFAVLLFTCGIASVGILAWIIGKSVKGPVPTSLILILAGLTICIVVAAVFIGSKTAAQQENVDTGKRPEPPAPQAPTFHDTDRDGNKYVVNWDSDPNCSGFDHAASHRCNFTHTQMSFAGDNTPYDHWDLKFEAPGPVTSVICQTTGSNEFNQVKGDNKGEIDGHWARCQGWINGGDAPIHMTAYYQQHW